MLESLLYSTPCCSRWSIFATRNATVSSQQTVLPWSTVVHVQACNGLSRWRTNAVHVSVLLLDYLKIYGHCFRETERSNETNKSRFIGSDSKIFLILVLPCSPSFCFSGTLSSQWLQTWLVRQHPDSPVFPDEVMNCWTDEIVNVHTVTKETHRHRHIHLKSEILNLSYPLSTFRNEIEVLTS